MIITGYQGIGKSTLSKTNDKIMHNREKEIIWENALQPYWL